MPAELIDILSILLLWNRWNV